MIDIKKPEDCCGCGACVQACPKACISFDADPAEGFRYPKVDLSLCIHCNLCERVCPVLNIPAASEPVKVLSAVNPVMEQRMESSSGGIFTLLAEKVISRGGSVFGVAMASDCRAASHIEVSDIADIACLRGSKYIQADTGDVFKIVKRRLLDGKPVMFTGTPCQARGLKLFLGAKLAISPLLLTVDVVCHGTPSPEAWRAYLDWRAKGEPVYAVNFRDKTGSGWRSFGLSLRLRPYDLQPSDEGRLASPCGAKVKAGEPDVLSESHRTDLFMRSFLSNVNLRPSCYECPANGGRSGADITIADFWGITPTEGDEAGVSQILIRTEKGAHAFAELTVEDVKEYPYSIVQRYNPSESRSVSRPERRARFWRYYRKNFPKAVKASAPRLSLTLRLKIKIASILHRIHLR